MLSPVLVGPILRLKCMDAQCISNTTRLCLKAMEKHFFLLKLDKRLVQVVDNQLRLPICSIQLRSG